jgi:hypothetical protein
LRRLRFRRKAVSTMIGGIIVLSLFLIALTSMVVVNQQYDAYLGLAERMTQKDVDRTSEGIVAVYPGLTPVNCGSCNLRQYNMTLANEGGVEVQIARIYINSTIQPSQPNQPGCTISDYPVTTAPCVLGAAPITATTRFASMSFALNDSLISSGEFHHSVRFWLPIAMTLPNVTVTPSNSIWIVTMRGRVFSFTWPFPAVGQNAGGAGSQMSISTGSMKVAYTGTFNSGSDTCHQETPTRLSAGNAGTLSFLNPWVKTNVLTTAASDIPTGNFPHLSSGCTWGQCLYISVHSKNTLNSSITFSWGQMVMLTAKASPNLKQYFIGGPYIGIVVMNATPPPFFSYGTPVKLAKGTEFYLIFLITNAVYTAPSSSTYSGDLFTGTATMNNAFSNQAEGSNPSYMGFVIFLDGLYVRNNGGC